MSLDSSKEKIDYFASLNTSPLCENKQQNGPESDDYQKTLWISDIPHESKYCFVRVWGEQDEPGDDTWIEVKKMQEPPLPKVPMYVKTGSNLNSEEYKKLQS